MENNENTNVTDIIIKSCLKYLILLILYSAPTFLFLFLWLIVLPSFGIVDKHSLIASGKATIMAVIAVLSVISISFKMLISEIYCVFDPEERIQCDRAPKASAGLLMPLCILISIWYALPF